MIHEHAHLTDLFNVVAKLFFQTPGAKQSAVRAGFWRTAGYLQENHQDKNDTRIDALRHSSEGAMAALTQVLQASERQS